MASLRERLMGRDKPQPPKPGAGGKPGEAPAGTPQGGAPAARGRTAGSTGDADRSNPYRPDHGRDNRRRHGPSTRPTSRTTQQTSRTAPTTGRTTAGRTFGSRSDSPVLSPVDQLKVDLHRRLIERLDLEALEKIADEGVLVQQIRNAVVEFLRNEKAPLSQAEREEVIEQIVYEVTGLGPIEPLFRDPSITDILVNGPKDIYVERKGKLSRVPTNFRNNAHLIAIIDRIVSRVGRRVDESSPMVDARLPDGSRVNAIIPPLALDGPVLSIRRFGAQITIDQLLELGALTSEMVYLLAGCVQARLNILISGGTGSGKTTLLNALSSFIPASERVVTIEDAAELRLQQEHVVRLETRPPNAEGRGEVVARDLVKNALAYAPRPHHRRRGARQRSARHAPGHEHGIGAHPGPGEHPGTGPTRLSQELAVARRVVAGMSNRDIASDMVISVKTVQFHIGNVYAKLGVHTRVQLANRLPGRAGRADES